MREELHTTCCSDDAQTTDERAWPSAQRVERAVLHDSCIDTNAQLLFAGGCAELQAGLELHRWGACGWRRKCQRAARSREAGGAAGRQATIMSTALTRGRDSRLLFIQYHRLSGLVVSLQVVVQATSAAGRIAAGGSLQCRFRGTKSSGSANARNPYGVARPKVRWQRCSFVVLRHLPMASLQPAALSRPFLKSKSHSTWYILAQPLHQDTAGHGV